MTIIGHGAEALVKRDGDDVVKTRPAKTYRHPRLDARLRRFRTRRESKVLQRLPVAGPAFRWADDKEMVVRMQFLDGPQLRDALDETNAKRYAQEVGRLVRELHDAGICHGDLTTSNMVLVDEEVHLIDFGLSFFSDDVEGKAVDLHLLKHSLDAKHPGLGMWDGVLAAYNPSQELLERFEEVEARGRYKGH